MVTPPSRSPFERRARRCEHLAVDNLLRSLTEVIRGVPGGINLGQGVCDLDTPSPLRAGAMDCIDGGDRQTYTHYSGLPELKDAIVDKLARHNGLEVGRDQVMVASGSSGAFYAACTTLLEPGDEVVLFEPFYSYHYSTLRLLEAVPVPVVLEGDDYPFDPDRLRAALSSRTRAVVVNTPGNPTGKVWTEAELTALGEVLAGTDVVVVTDEVYEYMCFDGRKHLSPATVPGLADRTLTIDSFSKTFSITGWRIGFLAGPEDVVEACGRTFDQSNVCAARPMQRGVARALAQLPESFYSGLQADYERRRDRMCLALETAGFRFARPQGAYYVMADYREVFGDVEPEAAVRSMIERVGVNAVPGHLFHSPGAQIRTMRFHFAVEDEVLSQVEQRMAGLGGAAGGR